MYVIGIAGGVASGKSLVSQCFRHMGAKILDADRIGHEVLSKTDVIALIEAAWGTAVIDDNREINRKALAKIVFDSSSGPTELAKLEAITHPRITERIQDLLARLEEHNPKSVIVMDAPVMFKAGWDHWCDKIVFVDVPLELRQERAELRGWSVGEIERREARQTSLEEKRQKSTDLIDNSGSQEATFNQVKQLWKKWGLPLSKVPEFSESLFSNP